MNKPLVIHVDYGSRGNSGLYILSTLNYLNINAEVKGYVSCSFVYPCNKKIIKIFDNLSNKISNRYFRKIVRYLELIFSLSFIFTSLSLSYRPIYVFVSLYEPFLAYKWFLQLTKINRNVKITAIVHDADSLYNNYPKVILCEQDQIIHYADYLLVHTIESGLKLQKYNKPIWRIPFPLMPLLKSETINHYRTNNINFLFIGYLRKEKGIEILIESWKQIQDDYDNINLTIAGEVPFNLKYNFSNLKNFTPILEFLDDEKYSEIIDRSTYIILPYTSGTNSGVLATVASLNKPIIVSDIPMFTESFFCIPELVFKKNNVKSLANKLKHIINNHDANYEYLVNKIKMSNNKNKNEFIKQLNDAHMSIINYSRAK